MRYNWLWECIHTMYEDEIMFNVSIVQIKKVINTSCTCMCLSLKKGTLSNYCIMKMLIMYNTGTFMCRVLMY